MLVDVKSISAKPSRGDGIRIYVERTWARRVNKTAARVKLWLPDLAFSSALSKWANDHPRLGSNLRKRYFAELGSPEAMLALEELYAQITKERPITLLHAGHDGENTAASILKSLLEGGRKPPTGSGPAKASAGSNVRAAVAKGRRRR
jgi:uncharacterized protein YeaO (DUF488 family)